MGLPKPERYNKVCHVSLTTVEAVCLLLLPSLCVRGNTDEVFTSSAHMMVLAKEEMNLLESVSKYIDLERQRLDHMQRYTSSSIVYSRIHPTLMHDECIIHSSCIMCIMHASMQAFIMYKYNECKQSLNIIIIHYYSLCLLVLMKMYNKRLCSKVLPYSIVICGHNSTLSTMV